MDWTIENTFSKPTLRTIQSANRFCYEKTFYFVNVNGKQLKKNVVVITGKTGVRIMTASPRNNDNLYCEGFTF
jgi:hypothetical protein